MKKYLVGISIFCFSLSAIGQYAPAAGKPGTTAIHMDSTAFVDWATNAVINTGWINCADTSLGKAAIGTANSATGKADGDIVSFGDGGSAILTFSTPVYNGPGWDFAVFENSFDGNFLELAFVEVSSDGIHYARFPAHSLTQFSNQIQAFDTLNPMKINNLAGKYKAGFGTPFDLEELKNFSQIDINFITHIRIIDVIGSIDSIYGSIDTAGNLINDPWPTNFPSSGFDLDAVGLIHSMAGFEEKQDAFSISILPNPANDYIAIKSVNHLNINRIEIYSVQGSVVFSKDFTIEMATIDVNNIQSGLYIISILYQNELVRKKKILIQH